MNQHSPINVNALILPGVAVLGLLVAVFLGLQAGTGDIKTLAMVFAAVGGLTLLLAVGTRYWLLIVVGSAFGGSISMLPVPFSYSELASLSAIGIFILHLALKRAELGFKITWLDLLLVLNLAWLTVTYFRNPIGFRFAGGADIGGRAYFTIAIAVGAYLVLSHARVGPRMASRFVWIIAVPLILAGGLFVASQLFPPLGRLIYPFYTGVSIADFMASTGGSAESGRLTGTADMARAILLLLCALYPPVALIFPSHPMRFLAFAGSWMMIFLSGFRNLVVSGVAYMTIATAMRKRWADLPVLFGGGLLGLTFLIFAHTAGFALPYSLQRALSFIPFVDWDSEAAGAAESSAEWRFEMWRDAWNSKKFIDNKLLGDGFGFSASDFGAIMDVQLNSGEGFIGGSAQEAWLVQGSFHSGPLSTIRVVGIVGLIFFTILIVAMAVKAWRLVQDTMGTPFSAWAMYLAIPLVYQPFEFYIIYGSFNYALPTAIMAVGYINFLRLSFERWKQDTARTASKAKAEALTATPAAAI